MWLSVAAAALWAVSVSAAILEAQTPLRRPQNQPEPAPRKLHGRFLHITDLHPDSNYKHGTDPDNKCHRGKGEAGFLGTEMTSCDTPWNLIDETFQWIDENLKDQIDFVIWTGDSARHDNDEKIPRSSDEIYSLNQMAVNKMVGVFGNSTGELGQPTIPVVPTLGNNDIYPHNIMLPGPSKLTTEFVELWSQFIPENQYHIFHKGAYYWQQVVPGKNGKRGAEGEGGLAVFSLNTLYFFNSNTAVDGCDAKSEPGYEQMEWLNVQLELMRELGMKVILIGHVPPAWTKAKMNWDPSCWRKYVRWTHAYRDIIVGHLYGHMNLDHFMLLDSKELKSPKLKTPQKKIRKQGSPEPCAIAEFDPEEDPIISVTSAESYLKSLRHAFKTMVMPKKNKKTGEPSRSNKHLGGKWAERYIAVHVGPSVVPNYFPTLRIVEYNISGLVDDNGVALVEPDSVVDVTKKKKKKKPVKRPGETDPTPPTKGTPPGPAYSVQPYSLLGYTQYFLNLTTVNDLHKKKKAEKKKKKKEKQPSGSDDDDGAEAERKMARVRYEVEYDTRTDKVYRLKDLTVPSYVKLAQDIVDATPREDLNKRRKKKKKSPKSPKSLDVEDYDDSDSEIDDYDDSDSDSDTNDHDDSDHDGDLDVDTDKTAGRKNKKKKKKAARKARDKVWHAFVKRAFVGTLEGEELAETYEMRRAGCGA